MTVLATSFTGGFSTRFATATTGYVVGPWAALNVRPDRSWPLFFLFCVLLHSVFSLAFFLAFCFCFCVSLSLALSLSLSISRSSSSLSDVYWG